MAYSYYYGGFIFFGIAVLALMIRFCCQVYGKRSRNARTYRTTTTATGTVRRIRVSSSSLNRSGPGSGACPLHPPAAAPSAGGMVRIIAVDCNEGVATGIVAPPSYDQSEQLRARQGSPVPPPPSTLATLAGSPRPMSPAPQVNANGNESNLLPPAYSSLGFEDSASQNSLEIEEETSVNQPLISA